MSYSSKSVVLFSNTATKTIANTTSEVTQFPTGVGATIVRANSLSNGDTFDIQTNIRLTCFNGETATFRVKIGGITITSVGTLPALTNAQGDFLGTFRVLSSGVNGTIKFEGRTIISGGQGVSGATARAFPYTPPFTIDTTQDISIDITYQWGSTNSSILIEQASLQLNKF